MTEPRSLRILQAIKARLLNINGQSSYCNAVGDRVFLGKEDLFADQDIFPCVSILEGEEITLDRTGDQLVMELPVTVHAVTQSEPRQPLLAGHRLLADVLIALFPPEAEDGNGADRLGGECSSFEYRGRDVMPREDGGKTTSVFVDLSVRYVLRLGNPTQ